VLKKVRIAGFKSVYDAEFEPGRVNLFIGGNGSGKSNVLEALGLLSACLKDLSDIELQRRGVRLSVPTLFKSAFRDKPLKQTLSIEAQFDDGVKYDVGVKAGETHQSLRYFSESVSFNGNAVMGRSQAGAKVNGASQPKGGLEPTRGVWDVYRPTTEVPEAMDRELRRMAGYAIYAPQTGFLRNTARDESATLPLGLLGGGLAQAARTVIRMVNSNKELKKIYIIMGNILEISRYPGWVEKVSTSKYNEKYIPRGVVNEGSAVYFMDKYMRLNRQTLSSYDCSEGTLYLLFIATLLLHPEAPKIFALDNVDNALNPAMTRRMLETLIHVVCGPEYRENNIGPEQVFLTSHNPTSLDAFDLFDDDQRVFVVARDAEGATKVTRLRPADGWSREDWIEANKGRNLSEMWIEGEITGALGL
jgi:predicted ATPase